MRVLVAGASGLLGRALVPVLQNAGHDVIAHGHNSRDADLAGDLTQPSVASDLVRVAAPDVVVNLVALTNVDRCEEEPNEAYRLNVKTVEALVQAVRDARGAHFIHISTDHVYGGLGPHTEDEVCIRNTYALSKYAGELAALRLPATVLRTNFFGPSLLPGRPSFSDWVIAKLRAREAFTGFADVMFNPVRLDTLSAAIVHAIGRSNAGVFNVGARGGMSKADFAAAVAAHFGLDTRVMVRASVEATKLRAFRPRDMRMNCERFEAAFGFALPTLEQEIAAL